MFVVHVLHFNLSFRLQMKKKMKKVTMRTATPQQTPDQLSTTFWICPSGISPRKRRMSCADKEMKRSVVEEWYGQQLILF